MMYDDQPDGHIDASHDESNWLVSYADMMTLLCGFFIMLFTLSHIDKPQYEAVAAALSKQFGAKSQHPMQTLMLEIKSELVKEKVDQPFDITYDTSGVLIVFQSTLFFETLSAEVSGNGKKALDKLIQVIQETQRKKKKSFRIIIEGHSDSRPVVGGPFASNWELSAARAARVVRLFLDNAFFAKQLTAVGYADTQPLASDKDVHGSWNEANLSKNRRVVVRILDPAFHQADLLSDVKASDVVNTVSHISN